MRDLSQNVEGVDDIFKVTLLLERRNDKMEERERAREEGREREREWEREREREREKEEEKRTRMMIKSESRYHSMILVWNVTMAKGKARYDT